MKASVESCIKASAGKAHFLEKTAIAQQPHAQPGAEHTAHTGSETHSMELDQPQAETVTRLTECLPKA